MRADAMAFGHRAEAINELAKMRGWNARVVRIYSPEHPKANKSGNVWIIATEDGRELCEDGYVR